MHLRLETGTLLYPRLFTRQNGGTRLPQQHLQPPTIRSLYASASTTINISNPLPKRETYTTETLAALSLNWNLKFLYDPHMLRARTQQVDYFVTLYICWEYWPVIDFLMNIPCPPIGMRAKLHEALRESFRSRGLPPPIVP